MTQTTHTQASSSRRRVQHLANARGSVGAQVTFAATALKALAAYESD
jgi:hypothetical protein